jgi:S1-C subfamily serine protease
MDETLRPPPRAPFVGLPVVYCLPGSAAFCSGVRAGDVILEINGVLITDAEVYLRESRLSGGDMRLKVERGGRTFEVELSLLTHRKHKVNVVQMYQC